MRILLSTTSLSFPFPSTSTPLSISAAFSLSSVAASPTPTPLWCWHCSQSNRCHRRKALGCLPCCRDFDGTRKISLILRWIRLCPVWALKKLLCLVPWYGGLRNWNMKLKIWSFWVWNNGFCLFFYECVITKTTKEERAFERDKKVVGWSYERWGIMWHPLSRHTYLYNIIHENMKLIKNYFIQ